MKGEADIGGLLMEAIEKMDPGKKGILTGYYYNQLSIQELARIHNRDPGTIYKILKDSRQALIRSLKEKGVKQRDYPQSLSLGTELFLSYGERAVQTTERKSKQWEKSKT